MKFLSALSKNKLSQTKWVYLQGGQFLETPDPIDGDNTPESILDSVDRQSVETPDTHAEIMATQQRINAEQAVGDMLNADRSRFTSLRPENIAGFISDAEGHYWSHAWNMARVWTLNFNSKGPIWHFVGGSLDRSLDALEASPLAYPRIDSALLNATARPTLRALQSSTAQSDNISLASIDFLEGVSKGVVTGFENEIAQHEQDMLPKFEKEEALKRAAKKYIGLGRQHRQKKSTERKKNQLAGAKDEVAQDIKNLRKIRMDQLQPLRARVDNFGQSVEIKARDSEKAKLWRFAAEVLQNPARFLNNAPAVVRGFNWRQEFGTTNAVDMLEALKLKFGDNVIMMSSQASRMHGDMEEEMTRLDQRTNRLNQITGNANFESVQQALDNMHIEDADEPIELSILVENLEDSLSQAPLNVDLHNQVYHGQPPRLTAEEQFGLLIRYFNQNPNALRDMNDDMAKRQLKKYLVTIDSDTSENFISGGIDGENMTPYSRRIILGRGMSTLNSASDVVNNIIPQLGSTVKSSDGQVYQGAIQGLKGFIDNYNELWTTLGLDVDGDCKPTFPPPREAGDTTPKSVFENLQEPEQAVMRNVAQMAGLVHKLSVKEEDSTHHAVKTDGSIEKTEFKGKGAIGIIESERNFYETILRRLPRDEMQYMADKQDYRRIVNEINQIISTDIIGQGQPQAPQGGGAAPDPRLTPGGAQQINQLLQTDPAAQRMMGSQGLMFTAGYDSGPEIGSRVQEQLGDRIKDWEAAMQERDAFSFSVPGNQQNFYHQDLNNYRDAINEQIVSLGNAGLQAPPREPLNTRLRRHLQKDMNNNAEKTFAAKYNNNAMQQWNVLSAQAPGFELSGAVMSDLTQLNGRFNLTAGTSHRSTLQNLRLIRKKGDRLIFENDGQVVVITKPKPLTAKATRTQAERDQEGDPETDMAPQNANVLVYNKAAGQRGGDNLYTVSYTNWDQAGMLLSANPANVKNQNRRVNTRARRTA